MLRHLGLASMRRQIFLLAVLPIFLLGAFAAVRAALREAGHERMEWATFLASKILIATEEVRIAASPAQEKEAIEAAAKHGLSVEVTDRRVADEVDLRARYVEDEGFNSLVEKLVSLSDRPLDAGVLRQSPLLALRIDETRSILVHPSIPAFHSRQGGVIWSLFLISLTVLPVLLLSYYLSYRLTRPLIDFAAAARRISMDDALREPFNAKGALEIRSLGESLNVMRDRITRMIDQRTSLLRSIGHDLRTPLTRLRMRAERCTDPELQRLMLLDITTLASMIDESMRYLSDKAAGMEPPRKLDLASLLQTITADYADIEIPVSFSGPRRLVCECMPRALTRALSNLIDNASRYATQINLVLSDIQDGHIVIEVRDNGPGLSDDLKKRAVEPFFKADPARTIGAREGIGLGLPIANGIAKSHGGTLSLLDRDPHGLIARITLPADGMGQGAPASS